MVCYPLSFKVGRFLSWRILILTLLLGLRYTGVWNGAALQSDDVATALLSGIQKRKPTFEKL